jgi:hypothetical protein
MTSENIMSDEDFVRVDKSNAIISTRVSVGTRHTHPHNMPIDNIFKTFNFVTCPTCKAITMQFNVKYSGGNWR